MAVMRMLLLLVLVAAPTGLNASGQMANPIRKVVTMLQNMQKSVTEEGEKQLALYDQFVCYCTSGRGDLDASIALAKNNIANFGAEVLEKSAEKKQTEADLAQHQTDRVDAKEAMQKATSLRENQYIYLYIYYY